MVFKRLDAFSPARVRVARSSACVRARARACMSSSSACARARARVHELLERTGSRAPGEYQGGGVRLTAAMDDATQDRIDARIARARAALVYAPAGEVVALLGGDADAYLAVAAAHIIDGDRDAVNTTTTPNV